MVSSAKYHELSVGDDGAQESMLDTSSQRDFRKKGRKTSLYQYCLYTTLGVSVLINLLWLFDTISKSKDIRIPNPIFSPANHIIQYKPQTFMGGSGKERIPYMGPPTDVYDEAWEDLYNSDAAQLVNHTLPLASEPDAHHHLHKKAWGHDMGLSTSDPDEVTKFWQYLDYCLESLRQSLMCSSDVSTIHWVWSDEHHRWQADGRVVHTCRDLEAIREWAFERTAGVVDFETWVADPLKGDV
ncbi:hypothetical protein BJX68DRAFT_266307 [Aspergillus pseudodeflectus]|uniref:Tat pathway signal sequence n=1 Tax=Aspergillus pseudodeflectus TaxID=176178 RepID=A0ABR4KHX9_9EURO